MKKEEIFENRREVGKKICEHIRKNNRQMLNVKFFPERPYCDGKRNYKFSVANYLRLISSENKSIYNRDPRWITKEEIQRNGWTLKEYAESELLEVWQKSSDSEQECLLIEFYNASDIMEKETKQQKNETLDNVLEFLKVRGLLDEDEEIITFQDGVDAIKKYAEENGVDELTIILTVQMFIAESKLKTKIESYLPIYPEEVLSEIEENPDLVFEAASQAQVILKKIRHEKIKPIPEKTIVREFFNDLEIIYHGSEREIKNKFGSTYPQESILTGDIAYEFLFMLKSAERQKIWLEFSYKGYEHDKFLIRVDDYENLKEESITEYLKTRLKKNRKLLLYNPQGLKKYIIEEKMIRVEDLLNQIKRESESFQSVVADFEQEEKKYLEQHSELLQD